MVDLGIDICITPPIPPQPSPLIQDHLLTLNEVHSKIKQNSEDLSLLQSQLNSIQELTKQVKHRIMEYQLEAKYLQRRSPKAYIPIHINTLPPEILGVIFSFCCEDVLPFDNNITNFTFDRSPWILSWVCRKWRLIVHQTSKLWSAIPGPVKLFAAENTQREREVLQAVCNRSGASLLRLTLAICEHYVPTQSLFRYIAPLLPRVEELTFRLQSDDHMRLDLWGKTPFQLPAIELSSLRSLSLQEWDFPFRPVFSPKNLQGLALFFQKMPLLERMSIRSPATLEERTNFSNIGFPWGQLTSVTLQDAGLLLVRKIISCAEQLVSLQALEIRTPRILAYNPQPTYNPQGVDRKRISHHKLELLRLEFPRPSSGFARSTEGAEIFFDTINLPVLKGLSFIHASSFPSTVLTDFFERSKCSLLEFEFPAVDSLQSVLQYCPDVQAILLDGCVTDGDLEILSREGEGWLVPHLERLTLVCPRIQNASSLAHLIQARKQETSICSLRKLDMVTLSTVSDLEDDDDDEDAQFDRGFRTDQLISGECYENIEAVLKARCGYELVNDSLKMEKLSCLCRQLEELECNDHDEVIACVWEATGLRGKVVRIYDYLNQVADLKNLYPAAFELKCRYKEALRKLTHNPWVFDSPPANWVRFPQSADQREGCDLLSYIAPSETSSSNNVVI